MRFKTVKTGLAVLLLSSAAHADWTLDGTASSFYYVTSKAAAVSEVNSFGGLSGSIADNGAATLAIDLATVNTAVEIRDQRMRDIVFNVAEYPAASVTVQVDAAALAAMPIGELSTGSYMASVNLHGMSADLAADMQIIKLDQDTIQVQLAKPLVVGAASFGLVAAVEELKTIAGLPSITPNVVVDFTLVYHKR